MQLRISPNAKISWLNYPGGSAIVIDDVFEHASALREHALGMRFTPPSGADYYPGIKASASLQGEYELVQFLAKQFADHQWHGELPKGIDLSASQTPATDFCIAALDIKHIQDDTVMVVHADRADYWLAAVTYLFGVPGIEYPNRGTALWRHRKTGMTCWRNSQDMVIDVLISKLMELDQAEQFEQALIRLPRPDSLQLFHSIFKPAKTSSLFILDQGPEWELIGHVPARFNRLVSYPTRQMHSLLEDCSLPISKETCRLTMNHFVSWPIRRKWQAPYDASLYQRL